MEEKTLDTLLAGDTVILRNRYLVEVKIIHRITPKRIIILIENMAGTPHERQFNKKDGYEYGRGDAWYIPRLEIATPEKIEKIRITELNKRLRRVELRIPEGNAVLIEEVYNFLESKGLLPKL